jgi:hypothetical protein
MMHATGLPKNLWGEAINHAVWLKNRASTRALGNVTPYERLYGEKPNLGGVPEWGQCIWVHDDMGSKLDMRANEACWVGFDSGSPHAHRVYWMGKNSISIERNIKFVPITVTVFTPPPSYDASITPTVTQPTASTTIPPITPSAMMPPWMVPITITPRPTFMRRAQVGTQTPALSSMLPPTTLPQPISQAASDEDVADDEKEEAEMPGYTPQAPKKKKKKTAEPSQLMHKSQRIPKLSDYMKRLETGEGTTGEEFDTIDTVFSVEFKGIIAAAIHKADGDPKPSVMHKRDPIGLSGRQQWTANLPLLNKPEPGKQFHSHPTQTSWAQNGYFESNAKPMGLSRNTKCDSWPVDSLKSIASIISTHSHPSQN